MTLERIGTAAAPFVPKGGTGRERAGKQDGFARLLTQLEGEASFPAGTSLGAPPLDREGLLSLGRVMQEMMDLRALSLIAETEGNGAPALSLGLPPLLIRGGEVPSNYRREVPKNDDSPAVFASLIREASLAYGVEEGLIRAVIKRESNFNAASTSPKGAMGLMQLMPETARELGVKDPYDPRENIMAGTRYLKSLLERYGGKVPLALAAYNWGMGNLERHPDRLPRETRDYVLGVMRDHLAARPETRREAG